MFRRGLDKLRSLGRKLKSLLFRRKTIELLYFGVSVVFTGYVIMKTLPLWLALLIFGVVVVHEFGHYVSAYRAGRDVWLPFFVPLYWAAHGGTHVSGDDPDTDVRIALAGPTAGIATTLFALGIFAALRFMPGVWASLYMLAFQLFSGTVGSDGRKWRRAKLAASQSQPRLRSVAGVGF